MQRSNGDQTRDIRDIFKERGKLKRSCTEPVKRALVSNTLSIPFVYPRVLRSVYVVVSVSLKRGVLQCVIIRVLIILMLSFLA